MRCNLTGHDIFIQNTKLNRIGNDCNEKTIKCLRIYIDENLTWKYHLTNINKKISNSLFAIKQVKRVLPYSCLKTLYYSLIHSHLSYGILAWGNAAQSILHHTIILQKRALRIIHNAKSNSHTDPLFRHSPSWNCMIYKIVTKIVQMPNRDLKYDIQELISGIVPCLDWPLLCVYGRVPIWIT
jgi:hypothetical protein